MEVKVLIQKVEMAGEEGLILEVFVPYPAQPQGPADLVKAPEEEKNTYHHKMVAALEAMAAVERIRTGGATLRQGDQTRAEVWRDREDDAWEDYQVSIGEAYADKLEQEGKMDPAEALARADYAEEH